MTGAYAGVGSRETPPNVLEWMESFAESFGDAGWVLRSGGADGADAAFERGARRSAGTRPEIYLPWIGFNRRMAGYGRYPPQAEAFEIAARYHPAWDKLTRGARALHARNVHQVLGPDVSEPTPSLFVVCWTKDGKGRGGTGQAIRVADGYGVPVFDLGRL